MINIPQTARELIDYYECSNIGRNSGNNYKPTIDEFIKIDNIHKEIVFNAIHNIITKKTKDYSEKQKKKICKIYKSAGSDNLYKDKDCPMEDIQGLITQSNDINKFKNFYPAIIYIFNLFQKEFYSYVISVPEINIKNLISEKTKIIDYSLKYFNLLKNLYETYNTPIIFNKYNFSLVDLSNKATTETCSNIATKIYFVSKEKLINNNLTPDNVDFTYIIFLNISKQLSEDFKKILVYQKLSIDIPIENMGSATVPPEISDTFFDLINKKQDRDTSDIKEKNTIISPKVFISYSHDDTQQKQWVENFVEKLKGNNIEVIFDNADSEYSKSLPYKSIIYGTKMKKSEIFISYAWGGESETIVNEICDCLDKNNMKYYRDKKDISYKGNIKEFEELLGKGNYIILVVSDKFLKSKNCMYEILQIKNAGNMYERIFPIVLEDAKIYNPCDQIDYIKYWEDEKEKLDSKLKTISAANLSGLRNDIDNYIEFREIIPDITTILSRMNTQSVQSHRDNNYLELIKSIEMQCEKDFNNKNFKQ